jgi:hypothetical protein
MEASDTKAVILAIHPYYRGFGFAVLDPRLGVVDWGVARLYSKHGDEFLVRLSALVRDHDPALLVGEDWQGTGRRESSAGKMKLAIQFAGGIGLSSKLIGRAQIFTRCDAVDQYSAAQRVATELPELEQHLPAKRKLGSTIDERMYLFAAAALLLTAATGWQ